MHGRVAREAIFSMNDGVTRGATLGFVFSNDPLPALSTLRSSQLWLRG